MAEHKRAFRKHTKTLQNHEGPKLESKSNLVGGECSRYSRVVNSIFFVKFTSVLYELCIFGGISVLLPLCYL